ncbi:MAG: c-type cytochrome [Planctomycetales bacterium]|nr:c-type cytochrome [Planctomycetales bacterium]
MKTKRAHRILLGIASGMVLLVGAALLVLINQSDGQGENSPLGLYESGDLSAVLGKIKSVEDSGADSDLQLLLAGSLRQLGQIEKLRQWASSAEDRGVSAESIDLAKELADVHVGASDETPMRLLRELQEQGARLHDARCAIANGLLVRNDFAGLERLLGDWQKEHPDSSQVTYIRGLMAMSKAKFSEAEKWFLESIENNPRHELSYLALSEYYSQSPAAQPEKGLLVLRELVRRFPQNSEALVRYARSCRELGQVAEGLEALDQIQSPEIADILERAELQLDSGNFERSAELLGQAQLSSPEEFIAMIDAAFSMSMQGQGSAAQSLTRRASWCATSLALAGYTQLARTVFEFTLDRIARTRRFADLQIQMALYPNDPSLQNAVAEIVAPAANPGTQFMSDGYHALDDNQPGNPAAALYAEHCHICHGSSGDGYGPAARHLFPLPRDFRREPMRIVSAVNRLATDQDIARTIRLGMPGSSMPSFSELSETEVNQLVGHVRQFQTAGLQEQFQRELANLPADTASAVSASDFEEWLAVRLDAGTALSLPDEWAVLKEELNSQEIVNEGRDLFRRVGCQQCHRVPDSAEASAVSSAVKLFDELGRPVVARDLLNEPYRGGDEEEDIYRRVVLGIPGTPHPALQGQSDSDLLRLVAYVRQLATKPDRRLSTNYQRMQRWSGN